MKYISIISILLTMLFCQFCKNSTGSKELSDNSDSSHIEHIEPEPPADIVFLQTHLKDTISVNGNFILFLMPDSARFESLEDEPGIYEADSDFGVGASNTSDSIFKNKRYTNIKAYTTDKRYININGCGECPITIDRDTVNYGVILSSLGKKLETKYNDLHSGDYLQTIEEYFNLEKQ